LPPTVYDYFQAALRQAPAPDAPCVVERDDEGNCVTFLLDLRGGCIERARFRSTTCVTLLALCEHLRQVISGATIDAAARLTAADLLCWHPEIPEARRGRAELAVRAVRTAISSSSGDSQ